MTQVLQQKPSGVTSGEVEWVCPSCHDTLSTSGTMLICSNRDCSREYPTVNGIPILINEDRSLFRIADFTAQKATTFDWQRKTVRARGRGPIRSITRAVADYSPSLSLSIAKLSQDDAVRQVIASRTGARVLILGCGYKRFGSADAANIVYSDVSLGPITELVCDANDIPFKNETFDAVIANGVLSYVSDPYRCLDEIRRVLRPDGCIYGTTAFLQGVAMGRYDFTRWTYVGTLRLFRGFDEIDSGIANGPAMALAWCITYLVESFFEGARNRKVARVAVRYLFFWIKYLDRWLANRGGAYDGAAGFYFWGRKRAGDFTDGEILQGHRGLRPR